jgi:hypothetical protein
MRKSKTTFIILVSTATLCAALAIFFLTQGLDRADKYASVLALFATVILAGTSYLARPRADKQAQKRATEPVKVPNSGIKYQINAEVIHHQNVGDNLSFPGPAGHEGQGLT